MTLTKRMVWASQREISPDEMTAQRDATDDTMRRFRNNIDPPTKRISRVKVLKEELEASRPDDLLIWRGISRRTIYHLAEELGIFVRILIYKDKLYILRLE